MRQPTGTQLRIVGEDATLAAATAINRDFREHAEDILDDLIEAGRPFTAEDIRRKIPDGVEPHSPNVLPAVIGRASRAGRIKTIGWCGTTRNTRHGSVNRLWVGDE